MVGCVLIAAGAFVGFGLSTALITAGVMVAASFLLLTDVEEGTGEPPAVAAAKRFDPSL